MGTKNNPEADIEEQRAPNGEDNLTELLHGKVIVRRLVAQKIGELLDGRAI